MSITINNLNELKKYKVYTIYVLALEEVIYPTGFKTSDYLSKNLIVETAKYKVELHKSDSMAGTYILSTIKRPDANTSKKIMISDEIFTSLSEMFYSKEYAFGCWIEASKLDWEKIVGLNSSGI